VTASVSVIEQAAAMGADCLLVHHGLFWQRDSYDIVGTLRTKLHLLLTHDISLLAYHLPLDAHRLFGNNWLAAKRLGWSDLEPFPANESQPIGVKGRFPPMERQRLAQQLAAFYHNDVDMVASGKDVVQSAALVSGGGHKWLVQAANEGVDAYITGTRDEPTWHQAKEQGINFFALGHAASEVIGPQAFGAHLGEYFDLPYTFIAETNPF